MKKLTTLVLLAFFVLTGMSAQTTAKEQVQTLAERFFKQGQRVQSGAKGVRSAKATSMVCRWDSRDVLSASSAAPTFYAFEPEVGQGFVIVAGDGDNARVIGYSYENSLPEAANMPDGLADFLGGVDAQVMAVRGGAPSVSVKSATPVGNVVVNLNTAPWGQRAPFNNLCFTSTGASAATGCVPTAYSILMFHHKWPVCAENRTVYHPGTGEAHQIGYEYDWDNMISSYSGTYSEAQAAAVATLMRDFGYANGVAYGTSETGGNESATTLVNYFKYKSETPRNTGAAEAYVTGRDIVADDTTWKQYIKESLDAGCPIPYSSTTTGGGRHVFICDGYTDADYYHFNWGWSGSGNGWFTLDAMTPDASSNYSNSHKAYFMLKPNRATYTITVATDCGTCGTVSASYGGTNGTSFSVDEGLQVTLTATPNDGYIFENWTCGGVEVSTSATYTVTASANADYVAHFQEIASLFYTVNVSSAEESFGLVKIDGGTAAASANKTVNYGTEVVLTAVPKSGYVFKNWTRGGEIVSIDNPLTVEVTEDLNYVAAFIPQAANSSVSIIATTDGGGTATVNSNNSVSVERNEEITLAATPASGYYFVEWRVGEEVVSTKATFTTSAQKDRTYKAVFAQLPAENVKILFGKKNGNAYFYKDDTQQTSGTSYAPGTRLRLLAQKTTYDFICWSSGGSLASGGKAFSNEMEVEVVVTEPTTYYANFGTATSVSATASANTGGTAEVIGDQTYAGEVIFKATANTGYNFTNWTNAGGDVISTESYYTTLLTSDLALTANFEVSGSVNPSTPPVVELPEVTNGFIKGDGVLRFYRLALPITLSSYQNDFGSNATQVYVFWQEAETFLNKLYIPLGICFEVIEDARLIVSERNDIDENPLNNAAAYGTEFTNGLIGESAYDIGLWIAHFEVGAEETGRTQTSGVYLKAGKGNGVSEKNLTTIAHELGHFFGAHHADISPYETEPADGASSLMSSSGVTRDFFSVASIKAIREDMMTKCRPFYADAARTTLVGTDGGNNYVYGVVVGSNAAPQFSGTGMNANYRIPKGACFAMPINATDADGDRITYAFQQYEDGAKFHAYAPQENNVVDFRPKYTLEQNDENFFMKTGGTDIPSMVAGTYNFAAVVNDLPAASNMTLAAMQSNPFYSHYDAFQTQVTIVDGKPFTVSLEPNKASYAAGEKVTVSWGVNTSYFGTQKVNILLSDDYGKTFEYTLAENVDATSGSCQVTMPDLNLTTVREQFGNYKTNVRPGIIRVEVVNDIAYSLSWTNPASETAEGGFLVTGGSGEGGGDEGEQTEDITAETAELNELIAEMKAYIDEFATVVKHEMGGYPSYQVSLTSGYGNITTDMVEAAYLAMDAAEAALATATTKAEVNGAIAAVQEQFDILSANRGSGGEGDELANAKTALQALIGKTKTLMNNCGEVNKKTTTEENKLKLQVDNPTGAFYLSSNADHNAYCSIEKKDGDGIGELVDGDNIGFFHSQWESADADNKVKERHFLQVDLGDGNEMDEFKFNYVTRNGNGGNPYPIKMIVSASTDGSDFSTTLATLNSGLPSTEGADYESTKIECGTQYKSLRFTVVESGNPYVTDVQPIFTGVYVFAMSEFGLTSIVTTEGYEATVNSGTGVTSDMLIDTYTEVSEAEAVYSSATTVAELTAATEALQAKYDILLEASVSIDKQPLRTLIDQTQALVDACYDVKDGNKVFKYGGSLYITEADAQEAAAAVETAEATYNSATLQTQCDAEVARMQGVYDKLYYAVSHATLPVMVTTDWTNPYIYTIGINRSATSLLEWDANTSMVDVAGKYEFGNEAQAWCFTDATDGRVYIAPYQEVLGQQTETIAVSTGKYTASNNAGTYHSKWVSTECEGLMFSTGANNMVTDGDNISIAPSVYGCTWTLKAPEGYEILKYGFKFRNKDKGKTFVSNIIIGGNTYKSTDELQPVEVNGVNANSTTFKQSGDNIQLTLENFYVVLKKPSVPVTSSSYRVLSSNDLSEGNSKVIDVVKGTDGFTQEWTIVYNANKNMYNIYCLNDKSDKFYFSNHGGDGNKMGFYNVVNDAGSLFRFSTLDAKSLSYSDAYNKLYNLVHNDVKVQGTFEGHNTKVGFYTEDMAAAYNTAYEAANNALDNEAADATCEDCYTALSDANTALEINMPISGKYYRFRSASTMDYCKDALMYADPNTHNLLWSKDKKDSDATTYWCFYKGDGTGYYIQNVHTYTSTPSNGFGSFAPMVAAGGQISISSLSPEGKVGVYSKGTMMHAQQQHGVIVNWSGGANSASSWYIEEVNLDDIVYETNISKYGYAGLYLSYSVKVPAEVEAYAVTSASGEGGTATLTKIENGIVPANTGVILKSSEAKDVPEGKDYELTFSTTSSSVSSMLQGSSYKTLVQAAPNTDYFLFGAKNGVVALYKAYEEFNKDGKYYVDLTADEITAVTSTLPQAGYFYYLCNKHMDGDVYFSDNGNAIGFNKSSDAAYKYKWECIVEDGKYLFKNLETGKYFGWQSPSAAAYRWNLYDKVQTNGGGNGLQENCVSMQSVEFSGSNYLVVKDATGWDQASGDGFYNDQFSSSFYFVPVGKKTSKTMDGGYFQCSANKVYLPYAAAANAAKFSFRFDGGTTTDLEEALFGNEEGQVIFDLQGRRIERITAPGLYIVNGQKRYVKAVKF